MTSLSKVGFRLCPYDGHEGMWIAEREFRRHIRKCRQKYNGPLVTCMYNPRHLIGAPELFLHYQRDCQEKKHLDKLFMLNDEAKGHIGTALGIGCDRETKNDIPSELILQAAAIDSGISLGYDDTDFDDDQFVFATDTSSDKKNAKSGTTADDNFNAVMELYGNVPFGSEKHRRPPDIQAHRDTGDAADGGRQLKRAEVTDIWDTWAPTKNNDADGWKTSANDYSHYTNSSRINELDTWGDPPEDDGVSYKIGVAVIMPTLADFAASEGLDESQLTPTPGLAHPKGVPKAGFAWGYLDSDFTDGNNCTDADYELAITEQQKEWEKGSH